MPNVPVDYRAQLLSGLWIPNILKFSELIGPRSKNKRYRVLSLMSAEDPLEVRNLIQNGLVFRKKDIHLWTFTHLKALRLVDSGCQVMAWSRYENTLIENPQSVEPEFPFQIINLDFVSQEMSSEPGRAEREIDSVEATFQLQCENTQNPHCGFSMIYTTVLDGFPIDCRGLILRLNSHHRDGWSGLVASNFPTEAQLPEVKMELTQRLLTVIGVKYGYQILGFAAMSVGDVYSIVIGAK